MGKTEFMILKTIILMQEIKMRKMTIMHVM